MRRRYVVYCLFSTAKVGHHVQTVITHTHIRCNQKPKRSMPIPGNIHNRFPVGYETIPTLPDAAYTHPPTNQRLTAQAPVTRHGDGHMVKLYVSHQPNDSRNATGIGWDDENTHWWVALRKMITLTYHIPWLLVRKGKEP